MWFDAGEQTEYSTRGRGQNVLVPSTYGSGGHGACHSSTEPAEHAVQDDDLKPLRDRREWLDVQDELAGVLDKTTRENLRAEAKAPFRLTRTVVAGGLAAGAGLGLLIISTKLIAIFGGAPDPPDLQETLTNFGVNLVATVVLLAIVSRDLKAKKRDEDNVRKEEELGRLQVCHHIADMSTGQVAGPSHTFAPVCAQTHTASASSSMGLLGRRDSLTPAHRLRCCNAHARLCDCMRSRKGGVPSTCRGL